MRSSLVCLVVSCLILAAVADYQISSIAKTANGLDGTLALIPGTHGPYGNDLTSLRFQAFYETSSRLHIKITDSNNARWEVPYIVQSNTPAQAPASVDYQLTVPAQGQPFSMKISRSTGDVLFDTTVQGPVVPFVFEDQYLQVSTALPQQPNIYGIGERIGDLRLDLNQTYTIWNSDDGATTLNIPAYGAHPFYLEVRPGGAAHGVFMLNSNAMDVNLVSGALTYKMVGGIVDLYVFTGPTPAAVISQYFEVIGKPHFPPYWALGWHQCRWGYHTLADVEAVVANYTKYQIPLDTMWTDIDYMDGYRDFTFDPVRFPVAQMATFVEGLHSNGQHYIPIVDPGIKIDSGYFAYNDLLATGAYIRDAKGQPFVGSVWPGKTIFPDFTNPLAMDYWQAMVQQWHDDVPVDGMWIDMNEISNFCDGECPPEEPVRYNPNGGFDPNSPPYVPNNRPLDHRTVAMDAIHNISIEYNTHNLYGFGKTVATKRALENVRGTRSVVISRSSIAGSGYHGGHWLGDNESTFVSMAQSIPGMLLMNMYGIALVGADICGFGGNTTPELCTRWTQLGALYPFSRNHNSVGNNPQEPYVFDTHTVDIMRSALQFRYSMLPYYYTLFADAHYNASTVVRPLFFEFPADANTLQVQTEFMVGGALLVAPALQQGQTSVSAYLPAGVWYDVETGISTASSGQTFTLAAPIEKINVLQRGGFIVPRQTPALTTTAQQLLPYSLDVALDAQGQSSGHQYIDDGETIAVQDAFTLLQYGASFSSSSGKLISSVQNNGFVVKAILGSVRVLGMQFAPQHVLVNGQVAQYAYDAPSKVLLITGLEVDMNVMWSITVS